MEVKSANGPPGILNEALPNNKSFGHIYVPSSGFVGCLQIGRSFKIFATS